MRSPVSASSPRRSGQHLGQLRAGHHPVHHVVVGADPPHGAESPLAPRPQQIPLLRRLGDAHGGGSVGRRWPGWRRPAPPAPPSSRPPRPAARPRRPPGTPRGRPPRPPRWPVGPSSRWRPARCPLPITSETVALASSTVSKTASSVLTASGRGTRRTITLVAMPRVPSRAHEDAGEVVARQVQRLAAELDHLPLGSDHLQPQHVVGGDAVQQGVGAAGVLAHVAADGAGLLAGGVGDVSRGRGRPPPGSAGG